MKPDKSNLIWIDLEMTGLDTVNDHIIEVAAVVTDANLNVLAESPSYVIHQTDEVLAAMDDWNQGQHSQSGLLDEVRNSRLSYVEVEKEVLVLLAGYSISGASPMCGNSICQDRRFLSRLMPKLERFFHYRNLDVSTLKELAKRWMPEAVGGAKKQSSHRATDDIHESIAELKEYREKLFKI